MINNTTIEVCCGSITDALNAIQLPVDRIELNSALELGGLTPSISALKALKKASDVKVCCMVRSRPGDFCYSQKEFDIMYEDALLLLQNGADGIVFGFLNADNTVNQDYTRKMVRLIKSFNRTAVFHKAFDNTNMLAAVKILVNLQVDRILTSGGNNYPDITKGIPIMKQLHQLYGHQIQILPGGGIRAENVGTVLKETGIRQVHMSASEMITNQLTLEQYKAVDTDKLTNILRSLNEAQL